MNFKSQLEEAAEKYAEQFWNAREELEEEEQNSFDAEKDAFQAGAKWALQSEVVNALAEASRHVLTQFQYHGASLEKLDTALAAFEQTKKELGE